MNSKRHSRALWCSAPLALVARAAGWNNVRGRMRSTKDHWNDVLDFRNARLATIGAFPIVRRDDCRPLVGGQVNGGRVLLPGLVRVISGAMFFPGALKVCPSICLVFLGIGGAVLAFPGRVLLCVSGVVITGVLGNLVGVFVLPLSQVFADVFAVALAPLGMIGAGTCGALAPPPVCRALVSPKFIEGFDFAALRTMLSSHTVIIEETGGQC